ncbi:hypothetical protein CDL12_12185 [Handroanthus impetiginosus]|uniref:Uncharacterized protein n=1 Tax=Handroanthus impetiginosus TaxID=429701 RepID=A0A2G9HCI6_9LAMI|nr:hypothetical protein CDL12_12184 [Handroanthus impetiginosus]PIN15173.1 hypothetical protein CDL12_12185 [Handroanthus impetiginosus]
MITQSLFQNPFGILLQPPPANPYLPLPTRSFCHACSVPHIPNYTSPHLIFFSPIIFPPLSIPSENRRSSKYPAINTSIYLCIINFYFLNLVHL